MFHQPQDVPAAFGLGPFAVIIREDSHDSRGQLNRYG